WIKTMEIEDESLKRDPVVLHTICVENIKQKMQTIRWFNRKSESRITTNLYVACNADKHKNFEAYFGDLRYEILGKNQQDKENNIIGYIPVYEQILQRYARSRVFVDLNQSNTHTRYPIFENILLGVPSLFFHQSVLGDYIIKKTKS